MLTIGVSTYCAPVCEVLSSTTANDRCELWYEARKNVYSDDAVVIGAYK